MSDKTESKATKAESIHSIMKAKSFKVKIDDSYESFDVPVSMLDLYDLSQTTTIEEFNEFVNDLDMLTIKGMIHKSLTSMIIDCRALTKRVKKEETWSMELAEKNLAEFTIKPIPVPNQGKKEATPEEMIAKLKALGITPEELAVMMAR